MLPFFSFPFSFISLPLSIFNWHGNINSYSKNFDLQVKSDLLPKPKECLANKILIYKYVGQI